MNTIVNIKPQHLRAVITHAAKKDVRYYLNGVLLERDTIGRFYLVATDGSRLAVGTFFDPESTQAGPWQIIIPLDVCKTAAKSKVPALRLVARGDGKYEIADLVFTPIDGRFPDWRRVCVATAPIEPGDYNHELLADAVEFIRVWSGDKKQGRVLQQGRAGAQITGVDGDCLAVVMPLRLNGATSGADRAPRFFA